MASVLILGGGFGGLAAAHELRALLGDDHDITLVDRKEASRSFRRRSPRSIPNNEPSRQNKGP